MLIDMNAKANTESESESTATVTAAVAGQGEGALAIELLQGLEYQQMMPKSGTKRIFDMEKTKWSNCAYTSKNGPKAVAKLTNVALRPATMLREQSFVIEVDGTYKGPNVNYGSVTVQIAREKGKAQELVYRHSIVLSDVIGFNPFRAGDPLSTTMYVPESAFNMYALHGNYVMTVVFTNQDKQPFACARIDFRLE